MPRLHEAFLESLSNSELLSYVEYADEVPQAIAKEMVRRFAVLVDSGQVPDSSDSYRDELKQKETEIEELRDTISSAISCLESV